MKPKAAPARTPLHLGRNNEPTPAPIVAQAANQGVTFSRDAKHVPTTPAAISAVARNMSLRVKRGTAHLACKNLLFRRRRPQQFDSQPIADHRAQYGKGGGDGDVDLGCGKVKQRADLTG